MTKAFLVVVGLSYVALSVWCALAPRKTSAAVGFDLRPGTGESEYLVIYGGLQLALGGLFLLPVIRRDALLTSLTACVLIHASLVAFRTVSFFLYRGFERTTYVLAGVEWLILVAAVVCFSLRR